MREKLAREKAAGEEDKGKTHAIDSPNDASSEDSNDSNRFQKGIQYNSLALTFHIHNFTLLFLFSFLHYFLITYYFSNVLFIICV